MKVVTLLFSFSINETEISYIFVATKNITDMRRHKTEMLLIAGYIFAIIGHLVLITWFSLLLNRSLNII